MKKQARLRPSNCGLATAVQLAFGVAATPALAQQDAAATATLPTVTVTSDWLGTPNAETARKHPGRAHRR